MSKAYNKLIKDPDAYLRKLFAVNWLDEWSDEEISVLSQALKNPDSEAKHMVFALSEYSLDPEGFTSGEEYRTLLIDLFKSFGIEIDADNIEADTDRIHLEVPVPDGVAVFSTEQDDGWLSDEFFDFINEELLGAVGEEREFFILPPADALAEAVFHYPEVLDAAIEEGIIPDDDYFFQ